jgi:hypothetical protein
MSDESKPFNAVLTDEQRELWRQQIRANLAKAAALLGQAPTSQHEPEPHLTHRSSENHATATAPAADEPEPPRRGRRSEPPTVHHANFFDTLPGRYV